jgi:glycogen operon protein
MRASSAPVIPVRVHAPLATAVSLVVFDGHVETSRMALARDGDVWFGSVPEGTVYGLVADGVADGFDPSKVLLDPRALEVVFPSAHDRDLARRRGTPNAGRGPLAVARPTPPRREPRWSSRTPVVYEVHVRGFTRRRDRTDAGTYAALAAELPRLAALGVTVIELLPVHQFDPAEPNFWGYQPLAFGAVHRQYASGPDPAGELAELVAAAHAHDIEVWLDVVFNHTTEEDELGPTYTLRGLADAAYYARHPDGRYVDDSGCGNTIDARSAAAKELILWAADRIADLGVDGLRFDLASILARDPRLIDALSAWGARRGVRLIAEPWDLAAYLAGPAFPGAGWMQWNDRFRDDVRGFLRAEPGLVPALQLRLQGSPDLFRTPRHSVNFLTAHDGFTMHDLVSYDQKHNEANGEHGFDGSSNNRSWNCGWEGEDGAPPDVLALRGRQLRNAWCYLLLAHGVPMAVAGDEAGRTQHGNNNAFNQDNETSWVDWQRVARFGDLERFVRGLLALRRRHPVLSQEAWWGDDVTWYGVDGGPDLAFESRSLAWHLPGEPELYAMANTWWEPLTFTIQAPGPWRRVVDTSLPPPDDITESPAALADTRYVLAPRSVVVLES